MVLSYLPRVGTERVDQRKDTNQTRKACCAVGVSCTRSILVDRFFDRLSDGGRITPHLQCVGRYNREGLVLEVDQSLPNSGVISILERIIKCQGKPAANRCDNGPEYVAQRLAGWATEHQIALVYIHPSKSTQDAYIERFNRTAQHDWETYVSLSQ